jgi:hypothetical protein
MQIILGFAAFVVLFGLVDAHSEQQRARRYFLNTPSHNN